MSYTVNVMSVPVSNDDQQAWKLREALLEQRSQNALALPDRVRELHDRLVARFPCPTDDPDAPWSDGPLINNFHPQISVLGINYPAVEQVLPFLISTANELGFTVFDPQEATVHRPAFKPSRKPWWRFW